MRNRGTTSGTVRRVRCLAGGGVLLSLALPSSLALADHRGSTCETRANDTCEELLECVTREGVRNHQEELQEIADGNDDPSYPGTRAAGTEGSVEYVADLLQEAGYEPTLDPVEFEFAFPVVLRHVTPAAGESEFAVFAGSGTATVEGPVLPVDLALDPPRNSRSGCEAEDFAGLDWNGAADIALVQRGTCTFGLKAQNADQAGAEA